MRSAIYAEDSVANTQRRFGAANFYYVAHLVYSDREPFAGGPDALLFTQDAINEAAKRAKENPEDVRHAEVRAQVRDRVERAMKAVLLAAWTAAVFITGMNVPLVLGG